MRFDLQGVRNSGAFPREPNEPPGRRFSTVPAIPRAAFCPSGTPVLESSPIAAGIPADQRRTLQA
jgi:hypothetical protein